MTGFNHELEIGNQDLTLTGYRFGKRKFKVCLFQLSVTKNNQIMLKERYNLESNAQVILCFALGRVDIESEKTVFYPRVRRNACVLSSDLLRIASLFKNDFTPETFNEACSLIDNSFEQLRDKKLNNKVL